MAPELNNFFCHGFLNARRPRREKSAFPMEFGSLWRVFRVKIKCIVTTQIELPNELFSYVIIVSGLLPLTCCLTMESFHGVITFQPVLLTRVNLRMGYVYALSLLKSLCMLTCEMC